MIDLVVVGMREIFSGACVGIVVVKGIRRDWRLKVEVLRGECGAEQGVTSIRDCEGTVFGIVQGL